MLFGGGASAKPQQATLPVHTSTQDKDFKFPSPPGDSISSISVNGSSTQPPNQLAATSWDGNVNVYTLSYNNMGLSNITPQFQIKHDAPVFCSDFSSVSHCWCHACGFTVTLSVRLSFHPSINLVNEKNLVALLETHCQLTSWLLSLSPPSTVSSVCDIHHCCCCLHRLYCISLCLLLLSVNEEKHTKGRC
jgi:hypothetical protein